MYFVKSREKDLYTIGNTDGESDMILSSKDIAELVIKRGQSIFGVVYDSHMFKLNIFTVGELLRHYAKTSWGIKASLSRDYSHVTVQTIVPDGVKSLQSLFPNCKPTSSRECKVCIWDTRNVVQLAKLLSAY